MIGLGDILLIRLNKISKMDMVNEKFWGNILKNKKC